MSTSNLYPVPQEQWPGFAGPVTVSTHEVGVHRGGTVAASIAGTVLATGIYAGVGMESPIANIDTTTTDTYVAETDRRHTETHDDAKFLWSSSKNVGTRYVPVTEAQKLTGFAFMPDVPTFDLSQYPYAYRPTNSDDIKSFAVRIKQAQKDGWVITSAQGEGRSSDETRLDEQRGMGKPDAGNERLAVQYHEAGKDAFDSALSDVGISLEGVPYTSTSREVVIAGEQGKLLDKKVGELGYASTAEFIDAYKADPDSLSPQARNVAAFFFEANRGAQLDLYMTRQATVKEPIVERTEATRCLDDIRVDVTTVQYTETDPGNFPIVPLIVPAIGIRRKDNFLTEEPEDKPADEAPDNPAQDQEAPAESPTANTPNSTTESLGVALPGRQPRERRDQIVPPRYSESRERMSSYGGYGWTPEGMRRRRNDEIRSGLKVLGGFLVAASFLRPDAGYCPDPENWGQQEWSFSRFLPDSVHIGVGIPFTDIESDKVEFISAICPPEDMTDQNGTRQHEPDCDTRYTVYENGKLVHQEETNHPGAVTITKSTK